MAVAIDVKLDQGIDDYVTDINHHNANGNHYPATSVASDSRFLRQSPAGVVSWAEGVVAADAALKDFSNVASGAISNDKLAIIQNDKLAPISPSKITQDASNRFTTDAEKALWRGYNYIINGNFDIWQRGISQAVNGYGSVDRWFMAHVGSTKTVSGQTFDVGASFPDGNPAPKYYTRTVVTSVAGADNYVFMQHRIESVKTLAGKKATLAFYAKAEASKNMAIAFEQYFGAGGSPSARVAGIGSQKVILTTTWQRFVVTVDIPSITGKTLGTNGNDFIDVTFWFDAGSNLNPLSANLGQQSGTFDIANVSLVEGDIDVKPIPRSIGEEMALCQRYYYTAMCILASLDFGGSPAVNHRSFPVTMRAIPAIAVTANCGTGGAFIAGDTNTFFQSSLNSVASGATIKADAEL